MIKKLFQRKNKKATVSYEEKKKKILASLPKESIDLENETVISLLPCSYDELDNKINGLVVFTNEYLYLFEDNKLRKKEEIKKIDEFFYRAYVGAVIIEYTVDGNTHIFCKDTMSASDRFANFTKLLNRYKDSGEYPKEKKEHGEKNCPKCGTPYRKNTKVCMKCSDKSALIKRVLSMMSPYKYHIVLTFLLFLALLGTSLLGPYINKVLVDGYIENEETHEQIVHSGKVLLKYTLIILSMFGVYILNYIIAIARNLLMLNTGTKFIVSLRAQVYEKVQKMSLSTISRRTSGEIMKRITGDTSHLEQFMVNYLPNLLNQLFLLITVGTVLVIYDWKLALMIVIPVPIVAIAMRQIWRYMSKLHRKRWEAESRSSSVLFDIFSGISVVKSYGTEKEEQVRYDDAISRERNIAVKNEVVHNLMNPIIGFLVNIGSFFLLYYTGSRILNNDMTLGEAAMFSSYVTLIYGPITIFANMPRMLTSAYTSIVKIFEIFDEEAEVADKENALDISIKGDITLENVCFGYDQGDDILKNINLEIKQGEMVGIVGKSGVGKSTLINLIMRLYDVNYGSIKIDGVDIRDISQHSLRSQMGVVLQETFLFSGTVYENIAYAKPGATRQEVIEAAKAAGAHSFIIRMPDGYNTKVGEKGHTLSGGERQRVAIARALLHDPRILILDEATASLDTETEKDIQLTLQKLAKDRTTVAIAHRLSTLRNANRIIVFDKGRVAEAGTHEELLKLGGIYYDLVMAQRTMNSTNKK